MHSVGERLDFNSCTDVIHFSPFYAFSFQRAERRGSLELNAGERGEEGRFKGGVEEAGVEERWDDSETGFPTRHSKAGF